jgi:hypothetical protein
MNPKIKFAIVPTQSLNSASSTSLSSRNSYLPKQQQSRNDQIDDTSIDSLLDLLNSPERKTNTTPNYSSTSSYQQQQQQSFPSYSSSTTTPVATPIYTKFSSSYHTPPSSYKSSTDQRQGHSHGLDTSFDDLLNGLDSPIQSTKSSIPSAPFSSSKSNSSSSLSQPRSSSTSGSGLSLISSSSANPGSTATRWASPSSLPTSSHPSTFRCSRVVLGGSSMARGIKTSAFSKWFADPSAPSSSLSSSDPPQCL